MALENATFKHGGVTFPLTAVTTNELLLDADPARYYVMAFYASVLQTYMGARLAAEATLVGLTTITGAVAYTLPTDPSPHLTEEQVKFPLLAVWRESSTLTNRTVTWRDDVGVWKVAYVLPPLSSGQYERLEPILRTVGRILDNRTELGYDDAYLTGAKIFGSSYANLESIYVVQEEYGLWGNGGDLQFPSVTLTLEVKERGAVISAAFDAMAGVDTSLDNTATGETTLSNVVQVATTTT